jgi:hypothetical protein
MKQPNETKRRPGRPPKDPGGKVYPVVVYLTLDYSAVALRLGGGSITQGVRLALRPVVEQMKAEQEAHA